VKTLSFGTIYLEESMIITKLEELEKGKVKVYIDEEYHFLLYKRDIYIYDLHEDMNITDEIYNDIFINVVFRRAKQKTLAILKYMDRTEHELLLKLKQADYTDAVAKEAIEYAKEYHYVDDERYARNYIECKKLSKSKRQLEMELMKKGIEKNYIEQIFAEEYNGEEEAIKKAITKKTKNNEAFSKENKIKLANYLYKKGFQLDLINKYLNK
jgi:regulatory protein